MTQILNLTPHDIHIVDDAGNVIHTFPKSGQVIRLNISTVSVDNGGIPTVKREVAPLVFESHEEWDEEWLEGEYGGWESYLSWSGFLVNGIPISGMNDGIIVSAQVAVQLARQGDCPFEVYTVGDTVKDSHGAIVGTKFLVLN